MKTQNNAFEAIKIQTLKSLTTSISDSVNNPLLTIRYICQNLLDDLEKIKETIYRISDLSYQTLLDIQIARNNSNFEEIDQSKFVNLSIARAVDEAIAKYLFDGPEEMALLNMDLGDDFYFFGDEKLMGFVILNLLKDTLIHQAQISIWLDSKSRCLYFKNDADNLDKSELGFLFCQKVMTAFGGNIICKSKIDKWTEFELRFERPKND
jgi:two-component system CAI-1 autoinducer sensor kinase/phosphatase CqsS